jgi:hypothetical protein
MNMLAFAIRFRSGVFYFCHRERLINADRVGRGRGVCAARLSGESTKLTFNVLDTVHNNVVLVHDHDRSAYLRCNADQLLRALRAIPASANAMLAICQAVESCVITRAPAVPWGQMHDVAE